NSLAKKLMPVTLPPGRARLATRPILTGSWATMNTMGIVVVAALTIEGTSSPAVSNDSDLSANQIGRHLSQSIVAILCETIHDRYVLALDVARLLQPLAKSA